MKQLALSSLALLGAALCAVSLASASSSELDEPAAAGPAAVETPALERARPGLAWNDFDRDGRTDAFLVEPGGRAALLWNTGEGELARAGDRFGLAELPALRSASWQDVDGDGWSDLLLLTAAGEGRLLRNDAGRTFEDVTALAGLALQGVSEAYWMDFDGGAGRPDLVVLAAERSAVYRNLGDGTFARVAIPLAAGIAPTRVFPGAPGSPEVAGPTGPEALAPTRAGDAGRGTARAVSSSGAGAAPAEVPPTAGAEALGAAHVSPFCAQTVEDQAGGCLQASSVPRLGRLYPQSLALNVHSVSEFVGIRTTTPQALLDVVGSGANAGTVLRATTKADEIAASFAAVGATVPALQVRTGGRAAELVGSVDVSVDLGGATPLRHTTLGSVATGGALAELYDSNGLRTIELIAEETPGDGAELEMWNTNGISTVRLDADGGTGAASLDLDQADGLRTVVLRAQDATSPGAELEMWSTAGNRTAHLVSEEGAGNGAQLTLATAAGETTFNIDAEVGGSVAELSMYLRDGTETVEIRAEETAGTGAQIVLRKADGSAGIVLDAEEGASSRITTDTLQITGGADLVESFVLSGAAAEPGSVLVVDAARPGEVTLATSPYDRRVVGVVSGAGGVRPGLSLGQRGVLDGETLVALTGRVYVRCSLENGAIAPGDLLTTSSVAGHAMRATDPAASFGAVLGKALTGFDPEGGETTGLVLVLVSLQ